MAGRGAAAWEERGEVAQLSTEHMGVSIHCSSPRGPHLCHVSRASIYKACCAAGPAQVCADAGVSPLVRKPAT